MYGGGKTTEHPSQAGEWASQVRQNKERWRERATEGLRILRSRPQVDGDRVAAIGYCFGGATVLQLAYAGADLDGVVSFHGALPVASAEEAKSIRSEILICHGADDGFIPAETVAQFRKSLDEADAKYVFVAFSNAKHSFTNPEADERGLDGLSYNRRADKLSWAFTQQFFDRIFDEGD
jgi:dienelactone hydrolase